MTHWKSSNRIHPHPDSLVQSRGLLALFFCIFLIGCQSNDTLFSLLDSTQTGITFQNTLTESESQNILSYEYFYNGGGIAAADFNNDGLTDLFFVGNQVENKLYLNKGEMKFEDITRSAFKAPPLGAEGAWKTGVAVADINADGWLDIYVCHSGNGSPESRKNQLFINTPSPDGEGWGGVFVEQAEAYGIADVGYSTHATFFDYDHDGDLDLFVLNHNLKGYQRKEAAFMKAAVDEYAGDRLYRNDGPPAPGGGGFADVTLSASIKSNPLGFGLGVSVADFNQDGWPDLYVANDYVEEDYLYLNAQNGTFREVAKEAFGHFSYSAMGCDAADINNDALPDLFTADMLPEDNRRQKLLAFPDNWNVQTSMLENGFHWQNMRNMLQINQAPKSPKETPLSSLRGFGGFAEIGQLAGVASTDWSWAPLFADFDNDGFKDLFISNGFVKDLTDLDFVKYYAAEEAKKQGGQPSTTLLEQVKQMPSTPTHHYIFKNNGDLTFDNRVNEWGFDKNTVGCGAVYADLDNDGDWDLVTNNTNEPARIYQNNQQQQNPQNYLKVTLMGDSLNRFGLGTKVLVYANSQSQYQEFWPTHGFQSSMYSPLHFGLGTTPTIDSLRVIWPNATTQLLKKITLNQTLTLDSRQAYGQYQWPTVKPWFEETNVLDFVHRENPNIDFNRQVLLPRMYSRNGPRMATGDVNNDQRTDLFVTGAAGQASALFVQTPDGHLVASPQPVIAADAAHEDIDAVFFDADGDHDLDLYVVSGGYEQALETDIFQDRLYLNNAQTNSALPRFTKSTVPLPSIITNKCTAKALDYDRDGDQDLFLAGTVRAGLYPYSDPSYLLQNNGKGQFIIAQKWETGLLMDATVADLNQDQYPEVVLVGEFMGIEVLHNEKGKLAATPQPLLANMSGWYSRIVANDLDKDGDIDFVVGNIGNNTPLHASADKPLTLYYGDADQNGTVDPLIFNYYGDTAHPITGRDETLEQMVGLRKKFTDYKSYSLATVNDIFGEATLAKMQSLPIHNTETGLIINDKGTFNWQRLPLMAQVAPVKAILADDFNADGHTDLLLAGNESYFRIRIGKTDAQHGIILLGDGHNNFSVLPQTTAGFCLTGDVREIVKIGPQLIFSQNNDSIKSYRKQ